MLHLNFIVKVSKYAAELDSLLKLDNYRIVICSLKQWKVIAFSIKAELIIYIIVLKIKLNN